MARDALRRSALETVSSFLQAKVAFVGVLGLTMGVGRGEDGLWKNEGLFSQLEASCKSSAFNWPNFECLNTQ